jgi:hypothetical protein
MEREASMAQPARAGEFKLGSIVPTANLQNISIVERYQF